MTEKAVKTIQDLDKILVPAYRTALFIMISGALWIGQKTYSTVQDSHDMVIKHEEKIKALEDWRKEMSIFRQQKQPHGNIQQSDQAPF